MNSREQKGIKIKNAVIVAALAVIAMVLIIISRNLSSPNANLSQTEIEDQRSALTTQAPAEAPLAKEAEENASAYLFIILDNRVYGIEPLGEERDVTVDQGSGVVNVIHLLPDGFYMLSSTCDNQLCVTEGTVTTANYRQRFLGPCVYCLPHNLQLELVIPGATSDPNAPDI